MIVLDPLVLHAMLDSLSLNRASADQPLLSSAELTDSDDTPVDNEDQNWLPNVLLMLLKNIWAERADCFFGADMGTYHTTGQVSCRLIICSIRS
jgi:Uma2 family endonuclease